MEDYAGLALLESDSASPFKKALSVRSPPRAAKCGRLGYPCNMDDATGSRSTNRRLGSPFGYLALLLIATACSARDAQVATKPPQQRFARNECVQVLGEIGACCSRRIVPSADRYVVDRPVSARKDVTAVWTFASSDTNEALVAARDELSLWDTSPTATRWDARAAIRLRDSERGDAVTSFDWNPQRGEVGFVDSVDGKRTSLVVWHTSSRQLDALEVTCDDPRLPNTAAYDLRLSPDGNTVVATIGHTFPQSVVAIDTRSGRPRWAVKADSDLLSVRFSADGRRLAWFGRESVGRYPAWLDAATGASIPPPTSTAPLELKSNYDDDAAYLQYLSLHSPCRLLHEASWQASVANAPSTLQRAVRLVDSCSATDFGEKFGVANWSSLLSKFLVSPTNPDELRALAAIQLRESGDVGAFSAAWNLRESLRGTNSDLFGRFLSTSVVAGSLFTTAACGRSPQPCGCPNLSDGEISSCRDAANEFVAGFEGSSCQQRLLGLIAFEASSNPHFGFGPTKAFDEKIATFPLLKFAHAVKKSEANCGPQFAAYAFELSRHFSTTVWDADKDLKDWLRPTFERQHAFYRERLDWEGEGCSGISWKVANSSPTDRFWYQVSYDKGMNVWDGSIERTLPPQRSAPANFGPWEYGVEVKQCLGDLAISDWSACWGPVLRSSRHMGGRGCTLQ